MAVMYAALPSLVSNSGQPSQTICMLGMMLNPDVANAGVEGENVNLTPTTAFHIGCGFAEWLAKRLGKDAQDLRISVSALRLPCCVQPSEGNLP